MGLDTKATDWQVCGVADTAGGALIAAGLFVFDFYSVKAELTARCVFKGVGIGEGGNAGGTSIGGDVGPLTTFSAIDVITPFSIWDLNGAWGRVASAGAAIAIGYGIVAITAAPPWTWDGAKAFFVGQNVGGLGTGLGASAVFLAGNWTYKKIVANAPASEWVA